MRAEAAAAAAATSPIDFASLDALVRPRSVALIGASDEPARIGGRPIAYMKEQDFRGAIYPVNPRRKTVQGLTAYASVPDLPEAPDLGIIAVPGELAIESLDALGEKGCRAAIVFTAGFAEVDEAGQQAQDRLTEVAKRHGIRMLGPNCLGVFNAAIGFYGTFSASFEKGWPIPGRIGIVSQSGAYGTHVFAAALDRGLGTEVCITTGNEAEVALGDVLGWMAQAPEVEVICAYAEGIRESAGFIAALDLARRNRKPIVMMKVGRSKLGGQAAQSHTASIAGDDAVTQAVLDEFGVVRARTTEEMLDFAYTAAKRIYPAPNTLGVLTVSGGAGVLDLGRGRGRRRGNAADAGGGAGAAPRAGALLRAAQPGGLHRAGDEQPAAHHRVHGKRGARRRLPLHHRVLVPGRGRQQRRAHPARADARRAREVPGPALGDVHARAEQGARVRGGWLAGVRGPGARGERHRGHGPLRRRLRRRGPLAAARPAARWRCPRTRPPKRWRRRCSARPACRRCRSTRRRTATRRSPRRRPSASPW